MCVYIGLTSDFAASVVLAALIMAVEFCWQTQHRSDMGLMTVMCGSSCLQKVQKVVYSAALKPVSSHASLY